MFCFQISFPEVSTPSFTHQGHTPRCPKRGRWCSIEEGRYVVQSPSVLNLRSLKPRCPRGLKEQEVPGGRKPGWKCPANSGRLHTFLNLGGSRSTKWPHRPARAQLRRGLRKVRTETSLETAVARHSAGLPGDPGVWAPHAAGSSGARRPGSGLPEPCEPGSSCTGPGGTGGGGARALVRRTLQNDLPRSPRHSLAQA